MSQPIPSSPPSTDPGLQAPSADAVGHDVRAAIHEFEESLVTSLADCVQYGATKPHMALVESRRAAEAIAGILRCAGSNKRHDLPTGDNNDGLAGFVNALRKDKLISEVIQTHLDTIRSTANKGTHVGLSRREGHLDMAATIKVPLSATVRWLYSSSVAHKLLRHRAQALAHADALDGELARQVLVQTELQALREDHHAELAAKEAAHQRKLRALEAELQALIDRERALHAAVQQAEARAARADAERRAAEVLAEQRRLEVDVARRKAPPAAAAAKPSLLGRLIGLAGAAVAVAAVGAAGVFGLGAWGTWEVAQQLKGTLAEAPTDPTMTVQGTLSRAPEEAPPPAGCPTGTVQVAGGALELDQPEGRGTWPAAPASAKRVKVTVPSFCVEADRVARAALPADLPLGATTTACLASNSAPWLACLSGEEAAALCARRLPGGRLPTIGELELLARDPAAQPKVAFSTSKHDLEWLHDQFPPEVFQRPAADGRRGHMTRKRFDGRPHEGCTALHWAYNQPPDRGQQAHLVGFRCAVSL